MVVQLPVEMDSFSMTDDQVPATGAREVEDILGALYAFGGCYKFVTSTWYQTAVEIEQYCVRSPAFRER